MEQFKYYLIPRRNVKKIFTRSLEIYGQLLLTETRHLKVIRLVNIVIQLKAVLNILEGTLLYLVLITKNKKRSDNVVTIL